MFFVRQGPLWFRMTTGVLVLWGLVVGQPGDPRTYGLTVSRSF